jgi:hypothetical protein
MVQMMIPNFKRIPTKITNIRIKSLSCNQNNPMGQKWTQNGPMRNKMGGKRGDLGGGGIVGNNMCVVCDYATRLFPHHINGYGLHSKQPSHVPGPRVCLSDKWCLQ